jgi:hypothetical protein
MAMFEVFAKFEELEVKYMNARLKAQGTRAPADIDVARTLCLEFKHWCVEKRDGIPRMLDDPKQEFLPADRELWRSFRDETVANRLRELEANCPPGEDPPPSAPDERRAVRIPLR